MTILIITIIVIVIIVWLIATSFTKAISKWFMDVTGLDERDKAPWVLLGSLGILILLILNSIMEFLVIDKAKKLVRNVGSKLKSFSKTAASLI
jgi:predicted PurR-regulated permease PerM